MDSNSRLREEFSFLRGNILVMTTSWLVINFAGSIPNMYCSPFVPGFGLRAPFTVSFKSVVT